MAKKNKSRNRTSKAKSYQISLPLFVIPLKKEDKGLFGALNEKQMVETLKENLDTFPVTELPSRGKSKIDILGVSIPFLIYVPEGGINRTIFQINLGGILIQGWTGRKACFTQTQGLFNPHLGLCKFPVFIEIPGAFRQGLVIQHNVLDGRAVEVAVIVLLKEQRTLQPAALVRLRLYRVNPVGPEILRPSQPLQHSSV